MVLKWLELQAPGRMVGEAEDLFAAEFVSDGVQGLGRMLSLLTESGSAASEAGDILSTAGILLEDLANRLRATNAGRDMAAKATIRIARAPKAA